MTDSAPGVQGVVVMGVSGCGKTTVASALAGRLSDRAPASFGEADLLHPAANIAKMSAGTPLTDEDRWPWLGLVADWMAGERRSGRLPIVSCSALKRSYRDLLRDAGGRIAFVHLAGPPEIILERMQRRSGHFMPATLLASQFADLEQLQADECGVTVDLTAPEARVIDAAHAWLTERAVPARN